MRYYRDLQPGETLQAEDERLHYGRVWATVDAAIYGADPGAYLAEYRRPVDAVPREEYEQLQRAVEACSRYFEHCERVSVSQQRSDSGQMNVRMALRNEAREAIQTLKEAQQ